MKDIILSKLSKVKGNGVKYIACCPAHDDKSPSLSLLFNPDGRILIHCHAGCEALDVLSAIGLTLSDLYPDGAIRDFMASVNQKPKKNRYELWLEFFEERKGKLKPDERMSRESIELAKRMYLRAKNAR